MRDDGGVVYILGGRPVFFGWFGKSLLRLVGRWGHHAMVRFEETSM